MHASPTCNIQLTSCLSMGQSTLCLQNAFWTLHLQYSSGNSRTLPLPFGITVECLLIYLLQFSSANPPPPPPTLTFNFRNNPSWRTDQVDSGLGQWGVISGFLEISCVVVVLDLQWKFSLWAKFCSLPQERKAKWVSFLRSELIFLRFSGRLGAFLCFLLLCFRLLRCTFLTYLGHW